jgi:hypothetical protein
MGTALTAIAGIGYTQGSMAPPTNGVDQFGESVQITTIKKFGNELNKAQEQQWDTIQKNIRAFDDSYKAIYGKSVFSDAYQSDLQKLNTEVQATGQGVPKITYEEYTGPWGIKYTLPKVTYTPTAQQEDLFFYQELQRGEDYIFQRDGKTDYDNRNTILGKGLDDIQNSFKVGIELVQALTQEKTLEAEYIDPNIVYGYPQDVPHTEENATKINQFQQGGEEGLLDKLLTFLQKHPNEFNAATVSKALQDETNFMKAVQADWNIDSINRTIREGDYIGAIKEAVTDGVKTVEKAGEQIVNDVVDPLEPYYKLLKELWENAGTYIEMVIAFAIVVLLLWIAGQIKYVTT